MKRQGTYRRQWKIANIIPEWLQLVPHKSGAPKAKPVSDEKQPHPVPTYVVVERNGRKVKR